MTGILKGVGQIIDRFFDIEHIGTRTPHYGHKTACIRLSDIPPEDLNGLDLVRDIFNKAEENWRQSGRRHKKPPSDQNWRNKPHTDFESKSPEVRLERTIADLQGEGWVNQVPTSSGLADHRHDKVRNIDLLREIEPSRFEFIELKVNSNTPLFAAMEILGYGAIYLFSRLNQKKLRYDLPQQRKVLGAQAIGLRVLAPDRYYRYKLRGRDRRDKKYQLGWLEDLINHGLSAFLESRPELGVSMDFRFEAFPPDFPCRSADIDAGIDEAELKVALQSVQPVYPR